MRGSPPRYLGSYTVAWLLMAAMVVALMLYGSRIPAWLFMWALAGAIFLGFKWLMLLNGLRTVPSPSPLSRIGAYLFLWPGMDPRPFLNHAATASTPALSTKCAWVFAGLKTLLGVAVLLLSAHSNSLPSLVRGWLGMIGIVLLFHFGIFDLLSLGLRRRGFPVKPIMRNPLVATSLSEFWARRWNTAFSQLAHTLILLPLKCEFRITAATFAVFVISGLIHDLVISVPAGGGYGLPTAYFLFQGLAVLLERSNLGRRIGLGCGWRGRIFAVLVAALPAFWLFHPLFIRHVILPMLDAIGGLKIL